MSITHNSMEMRRDETKRKSTFSKDVQIREKVVMPRLLHYLFDVTSRRHLSAACGDLGQVGH